MLTVYHGATCVVERCLRFEAYDEAWLNFIAPNNQMCLLNQTLVSECLHYVRTKPLNELAQNKGGELC